MRYVVHPGIVVSRNDGDRHFISAPRLLQLYGVSEIGNKIIVLRDDVDRAFYRERPGDVHLRPLYSGAYPMFGQ